jgi:hypothetical protein
VAPHSPFKPNRAGRPSLDHCASMLGRPKIKVVTEVRILMIPADATGGWVDGYSSEAREQGATHFVNSIIRVWVGRVRVAHGICLRR